MKFLLALALSTLAFAAQATEGVFDSNGVKIRYVTEGEGEAVVLIHGWMGDSSMWGHDASGNTKLSSLPGFEVIALDCRGHGQSDKPHDVSKYGKEMAEDVVRLLDHLKVKKAHLIGYSMGAFIVGNVAATHRDRVLSVTYGGQAPLIVGVPASGSNEVDVFAKAVDEGKGLGPYIIEIAPGKHKPTMDQANAIANGLYGSKDVVAYAAAGRSLGKLRVKARDLARCKAPTLFIYGGDESDSSKESIAAARKVLPYSEVKVVEGGTHISTLAKPEFAATIVAFLQAHKAGK